MLRTREYYENVAREKGWQLNPDTRVVEAILKAQNNLKLKIGEFYCPCKIQRIPENICNPCKGAPDEIEETGFCHCMLYTKLGSKLNE